ncbi:MAG: cyanophycin synthetase [Pirellulales bacterium]|nr:cyanophycin synthetase [Pirellulales bacterium]
MEFRKVLALRGPNQWANFPVLEAWVDLGEWHDKPSHEIPGFNERIMQWLPSMIEHRCSIGQRGGFFQRLATGTYPAHILEHITLALQSLAGTPATFGKARKTSQPGIYRVVVEYEEEAVARACLESAKQIFLAAARNEPYDVPGEVQRLRNLVQRERLGPSTSAIVAAATARNIPTRRLNEYSLVQLGYGRRQRRIRASVTDRTPAIAESIAQDKDLTRRLLFPAGIPVPDGRPVENAEDAWKAAQAIGFPVVVKPQDGNQGRGVATDLTTREQVVAAYEAARKQSSSVIVEQYIPGHDYRVLVVGGKVVAAARREPAHVIGDGRRTIAQLVDEVNTDPRRSEGHATVLSKIRLDEVSLNVLRDQGFTPSSVPADGQRVLIRRNGNLSTGGTAIDVTEYVHPEVAARAEEAARIVGLDVAGVDVIAQDISRPLEEQGGAIVEINAAPGLRMHLEPSAGISRPVGEAIVEMLFPDGVNGRIPIAAVTGINGKTTTTRFIAHLVRGVYPVVGMTCTDGIYINDRRIYPLDCSGPKSATKILMNPQVDAAVFETARGGILRAGLAFDQCDVAVVTNVNGGDHLGISEVKTPEELAKVKRCIVDVVAPHGYAVLNADDPLVASMAAYCPGKVLYFALDGDHPVIVEHRRQGGRAAFLREGSVVLAEGDRETELMPVADVPLTRGGVIRFHVENTLAAVAAAWCLGVPLEVIRHRAAGMSPDLNKVPARFNILQIEGATVIVDYGHNAHALQAVLDVIETFPHSRRMAVYSAAGDRRDEVFIRQGKLLGAAFDRVILYEDHHRRGRPVGEIIGLFRQGVVQSSRVKEILEVNGAIKAAELAMSLVRPGELLLLQADWIDETLDWIKEYLVQLADKKSAPTPAELTFAPASEATLVVEPSPTGEIDVPILVDSPAAGKS